MNATLNIRKIDRYALVAALLYGMRVTDGHESFILTSIEREDGSGHSFNLDCRVGPDWAHRKAYLRIAGDRQTNSFRFITGG